MFIGESVNKLSDIPNREGFQFIGIKENGQEIACVVMRSPVGYFSVYTADSLVPCWCELKGWKAYVK